MPDRRLGVGFIGSGFNARFHLQAFQAVRDADVLGVWSPTRKRADEMAALARHLDLGQANAYRSIADMVADPAIDALWLCGRNDARIENMEEITDAVVRGRGGLKGSACEKPLARNRAEAQRGGEAVTQAGSGPGHARRASRGPAPSTPSGCSSRWAKTWTTRSVPRKTSPAS